MGNIKKTIFNEIISLSILLYSWPTSKRIKSETT